MKKLRQLWYGLVLAIAPLSVYAQNEVLITPPVFSPQGQVTVVTGVDQTFEWVDIRSQVSDVTHYVVTWTADVDGGNKFRRVNADQACPAVPVGEIQICSLTIPASQMPAGSYTYQVFGIGKFNRFQRVAGVSDGTTITFTAPTATLAGDPIDPADLTYQFQYGTATGAWPNWIDLPTGTTHVVQVPVGDWFGVVRAKWSGCGGCWSPMSNEIAFSVTATPSVNVPMIELIT